MTAFPLYTNTKTEPPISGSSAILSSFALAVLSFWQLGYPTNKRLLSLEKDPQLCALTLP